MIRKIILTIEVIVLTGLIGILMCIGYIALKGDGVYLDGNSIVFEGEITPDRVATFKATFNNAGKKPQEVRITSQGGSATAGITLGEYIFSNALDVRVVGYCFSSCANYVFVVGANKIIEKDSFVGWHGSMIQANIIDGSWKDSFPCEQAEDCDKLIDNLEEHFKIDRIRQRELYSKAKVDERITVYGHDIACECSWTFSIDDMKTFGVENVTFTGNKYFSNLSPKAGKLAKNTNTLLLAVERNR